MNYRRPGRLAGGAGGFLVAVMVRVALAILLLTAQVAWSADESDIDRALKAYQAGDYQTAFPLFKRLAEQEHALAQFALGVMYHHGWGVPQDYVKAHIWYNLSAAQGVETARKNRKIIATKMAPEQVAEAQRLARE